MAKTQIPIDECKAHEPIDIDAKIWECRWCGYTAPGYYYCQWEGCSVRIYDPSTKYCDQHTVQTEFFRSACKSRRQLDADTER